jgi:hypothetical protein
VDKNDFKIIKEINGFEKPRSMIPVTIGGEPMISVSYYSSDKSPGEQLIFDMNKMEVIANHKSSDTQMFYSIHFNPYQDFKRNMG